MPEPFLKEGLTHAEHALATSPANTVQVQKYHRQHLADSSEQMRHEIKQITGVDVRKAASEVEDTTGTVVHVFAGDTMVQVFQLALNISAGIWNGHGRGRKH